MAVIPTLCWTLRHWTLVSLRPSKLPKLSTTTMLWVQRSIHPVLTSTMTVEWLQERTLNSGIILAAERLIRLLDVCHIPS